jgi:hypothetical protein
MTLARNKGWGYEVEVQAVEALQNLWPAAERTGASNQKVADDPDIISRGPDPYCLIVTKEKGQGKPLLVHLSMSEFLILAALGPGDNGLLVQVKGRQSMWIDTLYRALRGRAKAWETKHETKTIIQMQSEARGA